jgi:serine/threonine protein kinase
LDGSPPEQLPPPTALLHRYSINAPLPYEHIYIPVVDLEKFENYADGGYHSTVVGDHFYNGRYEVVHKLGFGGYSAIWLARDKRVQRYVSLKILVASESSKSRQYSPYAL